MVGTTTYGSGMMMGQDGWNGIQWDRVGGQGSLCFLLHVL